MVMCFIAADTSHLPEMQAFIHTHGANVWNWLPVDGIAAHMSDIAENKAQAVLAMESKKIVGMVSFCVTKDYSRYQTPERIDQPHGYICEAVVRADQTGRGLGTQLLEYAVQAMKDRGLREIYIDRHEENAASAGMMRKAGFVELETFSEPARRPHGSGRTTVCRRVVNLG